MAYNTEQPSRHDRGPTETARWYDLDLPRLEEDKRLIAEHPHYRRLSLRKNPVTGELAWRGTITVTSSSGIPSRVPLEITYRHDYPESMPRVRDIAQLFRREIDRHVLSDGTFCLALPERHEMDLAGSHSIIDFLDVVVIFVRKQLIASSLGLARLPGPDEPHGERALKKLAYEKCFGADAQATRERLDPIVARGQYARNALCPCGSGRRFRTCHADYVRVARELIAHARKGLSGSESL